MNTGAKNSTKVELLVISIKICCSSVLELIQLLQFFVYEK